VPEIEMPGHSRAALAAYPEYSCNNIQKPVPGLWGVYDDIYCTKEESFQFIESILEEVVNLFPGEYIHIGGDEAPKTRWKHCEKCQNRIKENNLKNEEALQSFFFRERIKNLLGGMRF
jgi:hexosaminidase